MATNRYLRLFLAFLILAGIAPSLRAQSAGYFIDTESGEPRFIQRLVWTGGEYALRYEVVIEREVGGANITYLREFTEMSFIEVSLPPGNYRFQITSYDVLDRPDEVSEWKYIEVRPAIQPEISDVLPELVFGGSYDETRGYVLNILGENFTPDSEFTIRNSDGTQIIPEVLNSGADGASLFIDGGAFTPGEYELVVKNPGGLEAGMGGIVFPQIEKAEDVAESEPEDEAETVVETEPDVEEEEKLVEEKQPVEEKPKQPRLTLFFANAAWAPVFPVHETFFGTNASFAGATARLGAVHPIPIDIYIGGELAVFWNISNNTVTDDSYNVLSVGANLLAMKWLPNKTMALSFRLGLSYAILPDIQDKFLLNIGASYLWRFSGIFTMEAGIDYSALFRENSFDGCFRPWLGVGIIF